MKTLNIVQVNVITKIEKPIVVLRTAQGIDVVRNPRQLLTDLQNSGRALNIADIAFARGFENATQTDKATFVSACHDLVGCVVSGNIIERKKGDEYVVTGNHPALTDKNHEAYGKVKDGGVLIAKEDGIYVDGFLTMPLTEGEKTRRDIVGTIATSLMAMYGFGAVAPVPVAVVTEDNNDDTTTEAFGKSKAKAA